MEFDITPFMKGLFIGAVSSYASRKLLVRDLPNTDISMSEPGNKPGPVFVTIVGYLGANITEIFMSTGAHGEVNLGISFQSGAFLGAVLSSCAIAAWERSKRS